MRERSKASTREAVCTVSFAAELARHIEHDGPAQAAPRSQHEGHLAWDETARSIVEYARNLERVYLGHGQLGCREPDGCKIIYRSRVPPRRLLLRLHDASTRIIRLHFSRTPCSRTLIPAGTGQGTRPPLISRHLRTCPSRSVPAASAKRRSGGEAVRRFAQSPVFHIEVVARRPE